MNSLYASGLRPILLGLQQWVPTIKRSVHADTVTFEITNEGILAKVAWSYNGDTGSWSKLFQASDLLGGRPMGNWVGNRRACTYARQVIAEVLAQRGV